LVKSGHVRVILTTNFDRLIERSLEAIGVSPTVISTVDAIEGALPLTHASCTVIKIHGDYLDTRVKNTPEELAKYEKPLRSLLDRVFDEYGLIVCGWSADWDEALRGCLERCKSRRFTTYWAMVGAPSDAAQRLIHHRSAEVVKTSGADEFFGSLHDKVQALVSFDPGHPLSSRSAVATTKRLLSDEKFRIELHDLVRTEREKVVLSISDTRMPLSMNLTREVAQKRLKEYEAATAILRDIFVTGCYWGTSNQSALWVAAIERLANRSHAGGDAALLRLRRHAALVVFFAGGLAALAGENYGTLRALFFQPMIRSRDGESPQRAVKVLYPQAVMDRDLGRAVLDGKERDYTPFNNYLFEIMREPLRDVLPDDERYELMFDKLEWLLATAYASDSDREWTPLGRFSWKDASINRGALVEKFETEARDGGKDWPPLAAGIFSSSEQFEKAAAVVNGMVQRFGGR
jgi:hypothetical protein